MDLHLAGKTVVVTGGSQGIGAACGHAFAAEGCNVVLAARTAATLERTADEIRRRHHAAVTTHAADLASNAARADLIARHPDIDILVNNAGAIPGGSILDLSMERWLDSWELKVSGYIHLTKLAIEHMQTRRSGTIVNIIGIAGSAPRWDYVAGSTGNAALVAFTKAVGSRSSDLGVRVVGINPGSTRTDRIETLFRARATSTLGDEHRWQELLGDLPYGRLQEPDEVAALTVMLCAPHIAYLSGTVIDMDGGAASAR